MAPVKLKFILDPGLKMSVQRKPHVNLMLHFNEEENAVEFSYPWFSSIMAKLIFGPNRSEYTFQFNRNYLRLSNILAEGWELVDVFRSLLQLALIDAGMYMVHGAVIRLGEEGILIPSFGNTGKTTTAWMLAERGGRFVTDEFAILNSENCCYGFPCSSLVSSALVKHAGLKLTMQQSVSLHARNFASKLLSTRFAPGGIKLHPDDYFQTCSSTLINRIMFIQGGVDGFRELDSQEALVRLKAIQGYEMDWNSNPFVLARTFFSPNFNLLDLSRKEDEILKKIVSTVSSRHLVSSSKQLHYKTIERVLNIETMSEN